MIGGNNNDDLIPRYHPAGKLLAVNGRFHKAKFGLPVFDSRGNLHGVADTRSYLYR